MKADYLQALPHDESPNTGSRSRGGVGMVILTCLVLLLVIVLTAGAFQSPDMIGVWLFFLVPVAVLFAFCGWSLVDAHFITRPRSPDCRFLLRDDLKFMISRPLMDVALTAILRPDRAAPGGVTSLLIFMENYSSRQRRLRFAISPNKALGLTGTRKLQLALAAGQAAVYRLPLQVSAAARAGEIELKIRVTAKRPAGTGVILPAVSGKKYRSGSGIYLSSRFTLRPFLNIGGDAVPAGLPLAGESFISLAVPGLQPRFELLGMISNFAPTQEIPLPAPAASTAPARSPA